MRFGHTKGPSKFEWIKKIKNQKYERKKSLRFDSTKKNLNQKGPGPRYNFF